MARRRGRDNKIYRQTTGTRAAWPASGAAPNLSEWTAVGDVTLPLERGEADASTRNSDWEEVLGGLIKAPLEIKVPYNPSDTSLMALRTAFFAGTTVALAVCDGTAATAGTNGVWADWEVLKFAKGEPLDGADTIDIALKPSAQSAVPPAAFTTGA